MKKKSAARSAFFNPRVNQFCVLADLRRSGVACLWPLPRWERPCAAKAFERAGSIGTRTDFTQGNLQSLRIPNAAQEMQSRKAAFISNLRSWACPTTVLLNDGSTSGNARAPQTRNRFERSVYLIKATELAAAGYTSGSSPTTIGWNYQTGGTAGSAPLIVYMQNTADTTNLKSTTWATAITGMTMVHNATTALPAAAGPFDITLTGGSPFTYTGGGLYVAFDWGNYTGTLGTTTVVWCNSTGLVNGLLGAQSNTSAPTTLAASSFRPETRLNGAPTASNDAAVTAVMSFGELPFGLVPAQTTQAVITNNGANTLTNLSVTLNVTGADTFTDTQIIPSIASCGGQATVTFATFTPSALGNDTVTVSVPADDVTTNNSLSEPLNITPVNYSYKYPGSTASRRRWLHRRDGRLRGQVYDHLSQCSYRRHARVRLHLGYDLPGGDLRGCRWNAVDDGALRRRRQQDRDRSRTRHHHSSQPRGRGPRKLLRRDPADEHDKREP